MREAAVGIVRGAEALGVASRAVASRPPPAAAPRHRMRARFKNYTNEPRSELP